MNHKPNSLKKSAAIKLSALYVFCLLASCSMDKKDSNVKGTDKAITLTESSTYRLGICSLDTNNNIVVSPVSPGSVGSGNVHVITHGWAPGYEDAVKKYRKKTGKILLAWDSAATAGGVRFFIKPFFPLAKSIIEADLTGTVLVFSWIDQSASSELHPCVGEDSTQYAAKEMSTALTSALGTNQTNQLHLLGHSFGSKVVTLAGIRLKPNQNLQKIQLTLFDSPEDAPFDCADNQLYKILPKFKPDRNYHFVDNYISYYDSCLSNKHTSLDKIVDVVLLPLKHGCTNSIWHPIVCRTCAHEYSVNWYTTATGDQAEQYGLWWSPLMNSSADTLDQYYLQSATSELTLDTKQKCPDDQVEKCDIAEPEPDL